MNFACVTKHYRTFFTYFIYDCRIPYLQSFLIMDPFVDNFMASCGVSLVESMLSAHLRDDKFDQNPIHATDAEVGWIFVVNSVAYLVTCPLVGLVSFQH